MPAFIAKIRSSQPKTMHKRRTEHTSGSTRETLKVLLDLIGNRADARISKAKETD